MHKRFPQKVTPKAVGAFNLSHLTSTSGSDEKSKSEKFENCVPLPSNESLLSMAELTKLCD